MNPRNPLYAGSITRQMNLLVVLLGATMMLTALAEGYVVAFERKAQPTTVHAALTVSKRMDYWPP